MKNQQASTSIAAIRPCKTILINASTLKQGGGLQVADSLCRSLNLFEHRFVVVVSSQLRKTAEAIKEYENVIVVIHDALKDFATLAFGRERVLDKLVERYQVDAVLTVFGPARWSPRCPHLCGFARPHIVLPESPFFTRLSKKELLKTKLFYAVLSRYFKRGVDAFWTENPMISERVMRRFGTDKVYTVTNYYNQAYDHPEQWKPKTLPDFNGITLLTITAFYPHKNLEIAIDTARILKRQHPDFNFRFVYTITPAQFPQLDAEVAEHFEFIGRVDIAECPALYRQADIMFQPSLLECFSATYPEAMKMDVPIVASDMAFARGLCGDAAIYYSPLSPQAAADAIYRVATDSDLRNTLIAEGQKELSKFDTYSDRAKKLINICLRISDLQTGG